MKWVIGVTGASGLRLAHMFLQVLRKNPGGMFERLFLVVSKNAGKVTAAEGSDFNPADFADGFELLSPEDFSAPIASGSFAFDGMVVIPASMSSLGAMASGFGMNLIHRCADVCMKERRRLILVPRETPFSLIHLENMTRLKRAGADIVPFIPSFYNKPESVEDMMRFFSIRLLDVMGVHVPEQNRWGEG
ncbi:MAG: UbiX family flavin prenyltransferase [Acidobacteria bacterium]|nr:UbiX family flavin prenyltransferase [Acidobacteriota bacterium]